MHYLPTEGKGRYQVESFPITSSGEDYFNDDTAHFEFEITDTTFSRTADIAAFEGYWFGPGVGYRMVSSYELSAADTATSISIWIDAHTKTDAVLELILLDEFYQNKIAPAFPDNFFKSIKIKPEHKGKLNTWRIPRSGLAAGKYWVGIQTKSDSIFVGVTSEVLSVPLARANLGQGWGNIMRLPIIGVNLEGSPCANIQVNYTSQAAGCGLQDGVLHFQSNGGTAPYTYFVRNYGWVPDSLNNLTAGMYHITAIDAKGCSADTLASVSTITGPTVSLIRLKGEQCFGKKDGEIVLSPASGGQFTYLWSNGQTDSAAIGLQADNYAVSVADTSTPNCIAVLSFELPGPREDFRVEKEIAGLICFYDTIGSIALKASGATEPFSFVWNNGLPPQSFQNNLRRGTYAFSITDANMCTYSDSVLLHSADTIHAASQVVDNLGEGSISVQVSGGKSPYIYLWKGPAGFNNPGTPTIEKLILRGTYILEVKDSLGCSISVPHELGGVVGGTSINIEEVSVFPNPFSEYITYSKALQNQPFVLRDIVGRKVLSGILEDQSIATVELLEGVYVLELPEKGISLKLIKSHP
jgi:hypothetical protein